MSVSSCLVLFLITCLISLHFCDCRRLGSAEKKSEDDQKFDSAIIKNASSNINTRLDHQHVVDVVPTPLTESMQLDQNIGNSLLPLERKPEKIEASPHESISTWLVPHDKKPSDQKDTELDSDYCPPKTHPPSHN